jgi:hypothetical protein
MVAAMGLRVFWLDFEEFNYSFQWQKHLADWVVSLPMRLYIFSSVMVYLTALEINRQVNVYDFYSRNTYLPGFLYALVLMGFGHFQNIMEITALGALVYGLGYLFRINKQEKVISLVFTGSFFIGVASVFEPLFLPLMLLPWLALTIFRSFNWREWFAPILAGALPWFYLLAILLIAKGQWGLRYYPFVFSQFHFSYDLIELLKLTLSILVVLFALWKYVTIATTSLLIFKKRSRLIYHFIWLGALVYGAIFYLYDHLSAILTIPFMYIIGVVLLNARGNLLSNFVVYLWLGLSLWFMLK